MSNEITPCPQDCLDQVCSKGFWEKVFGRPWFRFAHFESFLVFIKAVPTPKNSLRVNVCRQRRVKQPSWLCWLPGQRQLEDTGPEIRLSMTLKSTPDLSHTALIRHVVASLLNSNFLNIKES